MRIDHIALFTEDIERLRAFYCAYFGGVAGGRYHNPRTGLETCFVSFSDGARLEIMARPDVAAQPQRKQLGYAHIAFHAGSRAAVDALTGRLRADGCEIVSGPRVTGDGYYESCVLDPDGNAVEITG
jgi:lactoylglutathione lyase